VVSALLLALRDADVNDPDVLRAIYGLEIVRRLSGSLGNAAGGSWSYRETRVFAGSTMSMPRFRPDFIIVPSTGRHRAVTQSR
jgi:hypothetical protein